MVPEGPLADCTDFEWDDGNAGKNWERHRVAQAEYEEIFFRQPLLVVEDRRHSLTGSRFHALGRTLAERPLFIVFTVRQKLIRGISARPMNRRERRVHERAIEQSEESPGA